MKLRFSVSDIQKWASRYEVTPEEDEVMGLGHLVREQGFINKSQLKVIGHWKSPRSSGHIEKNDEAYIKEVTGWCLRAGEERSRIEVLLCLSGVKWPTASVILHLCHSDPYPILDFRALWSLGLEVPNQYTFEFWWAYVEFCRKLARGNSIDMRMLDRALWQYSKENQKNS